MTQTPIFTLERRVRFLDHLAINGNARAAAAHAGVSHETAYRARRQDAAFAGLWDAALAQARAARFDELLAGYAGLAEPDGFAEAAAEALDWRERATAPALPPTRKDY